jgi:glycosyltransferase involved in cell wall biosynthesis
MFDVSTDVVLHGSISQASLKATFHSIIKQSKSINQLFILNDKEDLNLQKELDHLVNNSFKINWIISKGTLGHSLNRAFKSSGAAFLLYIDNRDSEITLKLGTLDLFLLIMKNKPGSGTIYADYELEQEGRIQEIHLLKHHIGRVRDNQDYGKVFFFKKEALQTVGFADEEIKFNALYDLRLKLSEKYELTHLANRFAGSLYRAVAAAKGHNVFDYLLASKESQLEAEQVVTGHLKRINAHLAAGEHYIPRPSAPESADLKASVIIPVNNRPDFIATAIESVQKQTVKEVEVIVVVNGGPDDPTCDSVKKYIEGGDLYDAAKPPVRLLVYEINNIGLCLNMGAVHARGEYYVQLDSDDRLKPDAVEKILAVYEQDPKIGMVIGSYEVWQKDDAGNYSRMEDLPVVTHDEWTEENGRNNLLRINGAGAPRSIPIQLIRDIGFSVNEEPYARNYGEDYNMVLQISEKHRIGRVWDAIYEVVRHSGGTDHSIDQETIDRNDEAKDYMRAAAIKRRINLQRS